MSDKKFDFFVADSFWDIDNITPPRKKKNTDKFSSVVPVDFITGEGDTSSVSKFSNTNSYELACSYAPQNSLVHEVRIFRRAGAYDYHARFVADAEAHLRENGEACRYVPFFSYSPQYSQMNLAQRNYYYYFRDCMRRGEKVKCDEGYFFLYIYEIINLPHIIPPSEGIGLMTCAWSLCRDAYPRIDKYMIQWIVDYALLHSLSAPVEWLSSFLDKAIAMSDFKEFFVGGESDAGRYATDSTLAFLSAYNYRNSRYFEGNVGECMKKHIPACLAAVLSEKYKESALAFKSANHVTATRDTFLGALVSSAQKARIEADYIPLEDNPPFRKDITLAVKYAENKVRAYFSIKSRLSAVGLDEGTRKQIDTYFQKKLVSLQKPASVPEYEKQYEALHSDISIDRAREIEYSSWDSTRLLVTKNEEEELVTEILTPPVTEEACARLYPDEAPYGSYLTKDESTYLSSLMSGEHKVPIGMIEVTLVERINEKALDYMGDVVIEDNGGAFVIIDDYMEDILEWIDLK